MDLLLTNARIATMNGDNYGIVEDGAVAVMDGQIAWIGPQDEAPAAALVRSVEGRWVTPALIACDQHPDYVSSQLARETGLP